jgi:hypothetical protein
MISTFGDSYSIEINILGCSDWNVLLTPTSSSGCVTFGWIGSVPTSATRKFVLPTGTSVVRILDCQGNVRKARVDRLEAPVQIVQGRLVFFTMQELHTDTRITRLLVF